MDRLKIPQSKEDYDKMDRLSENLTFEAKIQFERLLTTIDGQAYILAQAEEFDKKYPRNWTGIGKEEEPEEKQSEWREKMDSGLAEYLNKFKEEHEDKNKEYASKLITDISGDLIIFLHEIYKRNEKLADQILSLVIGSIIIQESKDLDNALIRTHNIFKEVRASITDLDAEFKGERLK